LRQVQLEFLGIWAAEISRQLQLSELELHIVRVVWGALLDARAESRNLRHEFERSGPTQNHECSPQVSSEGLRTLGHSDDCARQAFQLENKGLTDSHANGHAAEIN
jgi:hypothetical protein